jgi:hypothetical protein
MGCKSVEIRVDCRIGGLSDSASSYLRLLFFLHTLDFMHCLPRLLFHPIKLLILDNTLICISLTIPTNLPPSQHEQSIHTLETSAGCLRDKEPSPQSSNHCDDCEQPKCSSWPKTTCRSGQWHIWNCSTVAILVNKMEAHNY